MKRHACKKGIFNNGRYAMLAGLCIFLALNFSCRQKEPVLAVTKVDTVKATAPPVIDLDSLPLNQQPKRILLSSVPPPTLTRISSRLLHQLETSVYHPQRAVDKDSTVTTPAQGKAFFTTYSTDDGLALDQVNCSYMDSKGNLWFGTNGGGVSVYNGKEFTSYKKLQGLANNIIWCITEDHQGNIWLGTDGNGVSKYDGRSFTNYNTAQGLAGNVVFCIVEDQQHLLWFGTLKGGVSRFDGKNFTNFSLAEGLPDYPVKSMLQDQNGNLWLGTFGKGTFRYDGKHFSKADTNYGPGNDSVWCIAKDSANNLWFGNNSGIAKYDGKSFTNYAMGGKQGGNAVVSIIPGEGENFWIGTLKTGIANFNKGRFTEYTTTQGLANNTVRSMLRDKKGNLWISTYGGGISKYAGNIFSNFTTEQGLPDNTIFSIAQDSAGGIWLATAGGGVTRYDGKKFLSFGAKDGLPVNAINCITRDRKGNIWIGTGGGGACKFDGKVLTNYTKRQGLAADNIFSIMEDRQGSLWFASSGGGVSKFDGQSFTNYTKTQGLESNVVFCIKEDRQGDLWFGTLGGGISKFNSHQLINYTTAQGLPDNVVWTIVQDEGNNMWFGTQQGLAMMPDELAAKGFPGKAGKSSNNWFQTYTTADGLPDNFITQVIQTNGHKLYVGTNLGLCEMLPVIDTGTNRSWKVGEIFNVKSGFPVRDVNGGQNAMFKARNGVIWLGTGSDKTGLVRFDPKAQTFENRQPPMITLNSIAINSENICWADLQADPPNDSSVGNNMSALATAEVNTYGRELTENERDSVKRQYNGISFSGITAWNAIPTDLVLSYPFNNIAFDFNAVETGKNFLVNYQYRLQGYDKDWSHHGQKTSANFGNISEGDYTFMVKAQSPEGIWSEPLTYRFRVLPPWWRTWWIYLLYAAASIGIIMFLSWWKNRRVIAQRNLLKEEVNTATKQLSAENEKVRSQKQQIEATLKDLKAAQAQLIQAEKMASLGELTAGIAHEIKNPLNFINNFSEVNREMINEATAEIDNKNYDEAKLILNDIQDNSEKINHHGKKAEAIVNGMLEHSRGGGGRKEATNINALCNEYLRLSYRNLTAKDHNLVVAIKTDFDPAIGKVEMIAQDIGRVLLNLFNNAFYTVIEKQKLATSDYQPAVTVSTVKLADQIKIMVTDNGIGIAGNIKDKIFQPFFTTKPAGKGTGLGLSLSYDIAKAHGGDIQVADQEGGGTIFILNLPT